MTYTPMANLTEFHDRFNPIGKDRKLVHRSLMQTLERRRKLIREEYDEVIEAIEALKYSEYTNPGAYHSVLIHELAKELADLLYVVYGTAEELDIPLEQVFNTVHESNMGKLWPDGQVHYNEYGKVIKPPTYSKPDLGYLDDNRVL